MENQKILVKLNPPAFHHLQLKGSKHSDTGFVFIDDKDPLLVGLNEHSMLIARYTQLNLHPTVVDWLVDSAGMMISMEDWSWIYRASTIASKRRKMSIESNAKGLVIIRNDGEYRDIVAKKIKGFSIFHSWRSAIQQKTTIMEVSTVFNVHLLSLMCKAMNTDVVRVRHVLSDSGFDSCTMITDPRDENMTMFGHLLNVRNQIRLGVEAGWIDTIHNPKR